MMTLKEFEEKYNISYRMKKEKPKYFSGKEIKEDIMSMSGNFCSILDNIGKFSLRFGTLVQMGDVEFSKDSFIKLQATVYGLDDNIEYCISYCGYNDTFTVTQRIFDDKSYKWYEHIETEFLENDLLSVKWNVPMPTNTLYFDVLIYTYNDPYKMYYNGAHATREIEDKVFEYLKKEFPDRF